MVFDSPATNLVASDGNTQTDVFRRDMWTGTTILVSRIPGGALGNGTSWQPDMSADGSRIVFESEATNLATPDVLGHADVFLWTASPQSLTRVSESFSHGEANGPSQYASISGDGTTVAFQSSASNLAAGGAAASDVFVRPVGGVTSRISVPMLGVLANGGSYSPKLNGDGSKVAFSSIASNLVPSDGNGAIDVFLRNRTTSTTTRVSTNVFGLQITKESSLVGISAAGTHIAFMTGDPDVSSPPTDTHRHLYLRDTVAAKTEEIDLRDDTGTYGTNSVSFGAVSGKGQFVVFDSVAKDLVRNDTNAYNEVFVRDRALSLSPFADWVALIKQQYLDFAGVTAAPGQVATWLDRLTNGETTIGRFLEAMAHHPTWQAKRAPLLRLYWAFFLREPDAAGLAYWLGKYEGGKPFNEIAAFFATSPEFQSTYGPLPDSGFVQLVYGNVLQRKADAAGVAYWVDQLQQHGLTRGATMGKFSESPEGRNVLAPYVDVLLVHLGMLRTLPTKAEFAKWTTDVISNTTPIPLLADGLRLSTGYSMRFP